MERSRWWGPLLTWPRISSGVTTQTCCNQLDSLDRDYAVKNSDLIKFSYTRSLVDNIRLVSLHPYEKSMFFSTKSIFKDTWFRRKWRGLGTLHLHEDFTADEVNLSSRGRSRPRETVWREPTDRARWDIVLLTSRVVPIKLNTSCQP